MPVAASLCGDVRYTGWRGEAVFSFQGAKRRFSTTFDEDVHNDAALMRQSFRLGQQEVLEAQGLWTAELEAMDEQTFWNEFIPPEADGSAGPRVAFADSLQGHFKKRWEDNDGDLFSLEISAVYCAAEDVGNVSGSDEINILAGLNDDYVLLRTPYMLRKWVKTVTMTEIDADPALLNRLFEEVAEFFASLN